MPTRDLLIADLAKRDSAMRADLARYVNIPTGHNHTPGLDELRDIVTERCQRLGATIELVPGDPRPDWLYQEPGSDSGGAAGSGVGAGPQRIPPAAVCRRIKAGAETHILLSGHLDTVFDPRGPFLNFTPSPDNSRAVGPGVVDMKGGIVLALHALESLEAAGVPVSWTFIFNSDEETGSYHSERALRAEAVKHTIGIAVEPALPDGSLAIERKGSGQFIIEAFGKTAHAGRDFDKGISAVYALARAIGKAERLTDPARGITCNIGPLKGGLATNIVPDYAAAWGNVRFQRTEDASNIARALNEIAASDPTLKIRHSLSRPAKPKTPEVEKLAKHARTVAESLGQQLPFGSTGGVCDGNILQDAGLPTLDNLGVKGGGLHTHEEWIDLTSMVPRAQLLALLIARLAEQGV